MKIKETKTRKITLSTAVTESVSQLPMQKHLCLQVGDIHAMVTKLYIILTYPKACKPQEKRPGTEELR